MQFSAILINTIWHVSDISRHYRHFHHKIWWVLTLNKLLPRVRKYRANHETTVSQDVSSSSTCHCVIHSLSEPLDAFLMLSIAKAPKGCGLVRVMESSVPPSQFALCSLSSVRRHPPNSLPLKVFQEAMATCSFAAFTHSSNEKLKFCSQFHVQRETHNITSSHA